MDAKGKAKLKLFIGMAAGVGKTYAMLREARSLRDAGTDVIVALAETHGRAETEALLEGLEVLPRARVARGGTIVEELDLEAVLARKPAVAVVDELAHSNSPGMRHPKRWLDVMDLLEAGISVMAAVNIQHLESLADSVELLTKVPISERVPDSAFDRADELQLVDIPPEELIRRLEEGKVYAPEASRAALANFFSLENIAVLRELALRFATQRAGEEVLEAATGGAARPAANGVLVAVGPSPNSEHLIRWARKHAYSERVPWTCLHVETGTPLDEADKARLESNIQLARDLGAIVATVPSDDVAGAILSFAEKNGVATIVTGKSSLERRSIVAPRTIMERVIRGSGKITVVAVQEKPARRGEAARKRAPAERPRPRQYALAALAVAAATVANLALGDYMGYWAASIPYLATISALSLAVGRGPILLAAALSALLWDFLFIPPRYTFYIRSSEDALMLAMYFVIAIVSGFTTSRLKSSERMLRVREERMALVRDLAQELAGARGMESIAAIGKAYAERAFGLPAEFYFGAGELRDAKGAPPPPGPERDAAERCVASRRPAGRGTQSFPAAGAHYAPLEAPSGAIGAIALRLDKSRAWTSDLESFLGTLAKTVSMAAEREALAREAEALALRAESGRLADLLLSAVSHELRTPLTVIKGNAAALAEGGTATEAEGRELAGEILIGAERLDEVVGNLLSMSRVDSGRIKLRREGVEASEIVYPALERSSAELAGRAVAVEIEEPQPVIDCDARLVIEALANLLRNAARHSSPGAPVRLRAFRAGPGMAAIAVEDGGSGVAPAELGRIFERFYRAEGAAPGGLGLGLPICRGIAEAHGGTASARNLEGGGFEVRLELPAEGEGK